MKHFRGVLAILLISILASSCSKEDAPLPGEVTGHWKIKEGQIDNGKFTVQMSGLPIPVIINVTGSIVEIGENNHLYLKEDGVFNYDPDTLMMEISFNYMGSDRTEQFPVENFIENTGTWERVGNKLILKDTEGTEFPYNINELGESEMDLTVRIKETDLPAAVKKFVQSVDMTLRVKFVRL